MVVIYTVYLAANKEYILLRKLFDLFKKYFLNLQTINKQNNLGTNLFNIILLIERLFLYFGFFLPAHILNARMAQFTFGLLIASYIFFFAEAKLYSIPCFHLEVAISHVIYALLYENSKLFIKANTKLFFCNEEELNDMAIIYLGNMLSWFAKKTTLVGAVAGTGYVFKTASESVLLLHENKKASEERYIYIDKSLEAFNERPDITTAEDIHRVFDTSHKVYNDIMSCRPESLAEKLTVSFAEQLLSKELTIKGAETELSLKNTNFVEFLDQIPVEHIEYITTSINTYFI